MSPRLRRLIARVRAGKPVQRIRLRPRPKCPRCAGTRLVPWMWGWKKDCPDCTDGFDPLAGAEPEMVPCAPPGAFCDHTAMRECHPGCGHFACPCGISWDEQAEGQGTEAACGV